MKKKLGLILGLILSTLSLGEMRSAYILVPSTLDPTDVKVSGIIKDGNVTFTQDGAVDDVNVVDIKVDNSLKYTAYGGTKYIEVAVDSLSPTDKVKYMIGYESGNENGVPRYTIISSSDIKSHEEIQDAFYGDDDSEGINGLEMMDFEVIESYSSYGTFPGRELSSEDTILSGFVVGDQEIGDDNTEPSNIVDIYYKTDPDSLYDIVDGGADINPTAADQNSEFELWAIKVENDKVVYTDVQRTDGSGKLLVGNDGEPLYEPERVLLYTMKSTDEKILLGGLLHSMKPDQGLFFPNDDLDSLIKNGTTIDEEIGKGEDKTTITHVFPGYDDYMFDIRVRFQGTVDESLNVNGKAVSTSKFEWNFFELDDVKMYFDGGQKFSFKMGGSQTIIIPGDDQDLPDPVEQKIYVMDDDDKFMKGEAGITSAYENTVKTRKTNITMKVMTESGSTEKNYEIQNIEE